MVANGISKQNFISIENQYFYKIKTPEGVNLQASTGPNQKVIALGMLVFVYSTITL